MIFNKAWLIQTYGDYKTIPFLFFWGHQPSGDGQITKSCLSQWWEAGFEVDGITYHTVEYWMMAEKARLFRDEKALANILASPTPAGAKEAGRLIQNFDPVIWDQHKVDIVIEGNRHKFTNHPALKTFLLDTGEQVLVEASPVDKVWGIGMAAEDPAVQNPLSWRGENLLGFCLMEVRTLVK
jgi:ribA/ribD-fused uncharacterized protein